MNQSPSLTNSINTYNPQSFSSSQINSTEGNIQNNSKSSSINTNSTVSGVSINANSIYSGTLENIPKNSNNKLNLTPIIFIVVVFILALGLFYKFYKDSKKTYK